MCGIIGYTGDRNTSEVLLGGLKKLEYRGYDSAGIALVKKNGIELYKAKGKVANLESQLPKEEIADAGTGIGHTRWATHGAPKDVNAHPHRCGRVVLVHNGIIENEQALRQEFAAKNRFPVSDTDTELIAMLIDHYYDDDPKKAINNAVKKLKGSYALGILFEDRPNEIYALRKDSPLIIGHGKQESFLASDIPAIVEYTREYWLLEEDELAVLSADRVTFLNRQGQPIEKPLHTVDWNEQSAQKGGYPHFMVKEINEQPDAIRKTIARYSRNGVLLDELGEEFDPRGTLRIVACGSAYHAGLIGKYVIEKLARIPVEAEQAGEFRYRDPILNKNDLVIVISQSGETADSLAALRLAKEQGIPTLGIVNVFGSTLAREADKVLYTAAGPEISVATTKAYSCQVALLYLLALRLAKKRLSPADFEEKYAQLERLPLYTAEALRQQENCRKAATFLSEAEHLFFIGRGADYYVGCEGSLKLKEISYIHSEAYAAGELKHGTISLIEAGTPVVALMTDRERALKTAANVREVRARGAKVLCIAHQAINTDDIADLRLELPDCPDFFAPIPAAVLTQFLAYYTAIERGNDVDQPRNLAKSVTVE